MPTTFKTNPVSLEEILKDCARGRLQLPDFQRGWVWDDDRIRALIASVSQAFPIGALMTLQTGGDVEFKTRLIEGAPADAKQAQTDALLLDGQQRMTSLYQTLLSQRVVDTVTPRQVKVKRWYYVDINAAIKAGSTREEAIIGVPADRKIRKNFGRNVAIDLSTMEGEFHYGMFPLNCVFDWYDWGRKYDYFWRSKGEDPDLKFQKFRETVLDNFKTYQVPVITLDRNTSREAVCLVFEKVNTGGKALDAFELVTAMYATHEFELRKDWSERSKRLGEHKILDGTGATEFLQAVSLLYTKAERAKAEAEGREPPAVSATRQALLRVPLAAYKTYAPRVEAGYGKAAKFLHELSIFRPLDLPYRTQLTPLAAILAELPDNQWEHAGIRERLAQWYWCGIFGELYGSTVEGRFAKDIVEVPAWLAGGPLPSTVNLATVRADRLRSMRSRLSAAYKGVNALLMRMGARDFRSGENFNAMIFFDENVDIHHIFPKKWCTDQKIPASRYDSIINKTPLTARTNRIIGGNAPSAYLAAIEVGGKDAPPLPASALEAHLRSHAIDPAILRADDFERFMRDREAALLTLIEKATGKSVYRGDGRDEPEEDIGDDQDDFVPDLAAE